MGDLNKRRGVIQANEAEGDDAVLGATVPLAEMFGYSTALRSMTQVCPRVSPAVPAPTDPSRAASGAVRNMISLSGATGAAAEQS